MVAVKFSPVGNGVNFIPNTGLIANGYKLFFYSAGTTTKLDTYTTSAGSVANANPVVLDTYGFPSSGVNRVQIWLQEGYSYKVVIASGSDTDPPASGITLADGITGVNDITNLVTEWFEYSGTPSYVSSTSFTVSGNQTALFHVGRRLKSTVSGGTAYSTITATSYSDPNTTVTVVNDSTALDAGLSLVEYGILSANGSNPSLPRFLAPDGSSAVTQAAKDNSTKLATTAYADTAVENARAININEFRLSPVSGSPIFHTEGGDISTTTIYLVPYKGNRMSLWNGTNWQTYVSNGASLALGTMTAGIGYDVFAYQSSGTITLEKVAWNTANARLANSIDYQNNILIKYGDPTRKYLGSFLSFSTTQTHDGTNGLYLYNEYNKVLKICSPNYGTGNHNYTTATWRAFNGLATTYNTLNHAMFFIGGNPLVQGFPDVSFIRYQATASNSTASVQRMCSYGLNTTTAPPAAPIHNSTTSSGAGSVISSMGGDAYAVPATLGFNYVTLLQYSEATGTTTWYGGSGVSESIYSSNIIAAIMM